jgi:hypothetical protein
MTNIYSPYIINKQIRIIGIAGSAGAGKDTIADYIYSTYKNTWYEPFAQPLKEGAKAIFGFTDTQVYGKAKETVDDFWRVSPRQVLQFMGTEMFRETIEKLIPGIGNDFWVQRMFARLSGQLVPDDEGEYEDGDTIVIPDVRFQNEYDFIISNGGALIHVTRPGADGNVGIMSHASESGFKLHEGANNFFIENNGTIEELHRKVANIVYTLTNF